MTKALALDLKKLQGRAFDRVEWAAAVLRRYHAAVSHFDTASVQPLRTLYDWMFVPPTLWPFNIQDVLEDCLAALQKQKRMSARHRLLIDVLTEPPDECISDDETYKCKRYERNDSKEQNNAEIFFAVTFREYAPKIRL